MEKLLSEFLGCQNFAVIGSFRSPEKYAYKIVQCLLKKGKAVFPVNPNTKEVLGLPCCPDITLLPIKPDVVNLVTQPEVTENIVRECLALGITRVWMQPGAESKKAVSFCEANGIMVVYNTCILLQ
jgi:predicted CoA-binding protein